MPASQLTIEIIAHTFPVRRPMNADVKVLSGPESIYIGVQKGSAAKATIEQRTPGDATRAALTAVFAVTKTGSKLDFKGPYAQGKAGERFFCLSWFTLMDGKPKMFRRLKIPLHSLAVKKVEAAMKSGEPLRASLSVTGDDGTPLCGTAKSTHLKWEK